MKSLFNESDSNELIQRVKRLSPDAKAQWGKMEVAQMLAHAQRPMMSAYGELKAKRGLMGIMFGKMAKKKLTGDQPFQRNLPTDRNFVVRDQRNFEEERQKLILSVQRFMQVGPHGITKDPHPFFGPMTSEEWDRLMWNHLDHHLRQFGV